MNQSMDSKQVILANPGVRLSFQQAYALQEAEILDEFVTTFYFKKNAFPGSLLPQLPRKLAQRIESEFRRRYWEGLREEVVCSSVLHELAFIGARRLGLPLGPILRWRNAELSRRIGTRVRAKKPKIVMCCDGWGKAAFPPAKDVGSICVLDQNTGHMTYGAKLLREEQQLHPDFADSISTFSEEFIEESRREALEADYLLMSSEYAKQTLLEIGVDEQKIRIIPYAAHVERFSPDLEKKNKELHFLFVGTICQRKGVKYILEAFKKLKLPNARLTFVGAIMGSGRGLEPYRKHFTHIENVPHHEIHQLFSSADVFLMPSLHESGVLAIHEALASGLPVITTPNAGSIVRDGKDGFVVPIRDVEALAEKMEKLYRDEQLRREMGVNARKRAEEFTWERYRKTLGDVLKSF